MNPPGQRTPHLHQAKWRGICRALNLLAATPLIVVGHSNGGADAVDLAPCLQTQGKSVDLLFSADSVLTLRRHRRRQQNPGEREAELQSVRHPDAGMAARAVSDWHALYEIAGGDKTGSGYKRPHLLRDLTLAVLRSETGFDIIHNAGTPLQELATKSRVVIKLQTTTFARTLRP